MYAAQRQVRLLPALASGAVVSGLGLALVLGLRVSEIADRAEALVSVAFSLERPAPPPQPKPKALPQTEAAAPKGDPGRRNLRNRATPVVAPKPKIDLKPPPTVVTAPKANTGDATQTGASNVRGPGEGAGDYGDGLGGGGLGWEGSGRGGGGPPVVGPRQIRGSLSYRDLSGLLPEGHGAVGVEVLFAVLPDGRVDDCQAVRSSGRPQLDAHICRLIEQRFVYRPARDRTGRPVRSRVIEEHSWFGRPES
jgi:periplasmic protein TonB